MANQAKSSDGIFIRALRQLGTYDLTFTQLAALVYLSEFPDTRISELAVVLGRTVAATGRLARDLEQGNLLKRAASRSDARVTLLRLTPAGRRFVVTIHERRAGAIHIGPELLSRLSIRERDVVAEAMQILRRLDQTITRGVGVENH